MPAGHGVGRDTLSRQRERLGDARLFRQQAMQRARLAEVFAEAVEECVDGPPHKRFSSREGLPR